MAIHRYVALGDSFSEGVGDLDPTRPNGVRGWADRVAEVLSAQARAHGEEFRYANLAVRGRQLRQILVEQVEPAVAMRPDLITIYAGANDILRPRVDIDALIEEYDASLRRLAATGARLVVFTAFDPGGSAAFRMTRGRFATYNELLRWKAEAHGGTIVDYWRMREYRDWRLWDPDRMHMGPEGHHVMAIAVLDALGIAHDLQPLPLSEDSDGLSAALSNRQWAREHLGPWLLRRVKRQSSGDDLSARRPELTPFDLALDRARGDLHADEGTERRNDDRSPA